MFFTKDIAIKQCAVVHVQGHFTVACITAHDTVSRLVDGEFAWKISHVEYVPSDDLDSDSFLRVRAERKNFIRRQDLE